MSTKVDFLILSRGASGTKTFSFLDMYRVVLRQLSTLQSSDYQRFIIHLLTINLDRGNRRLVVVIRAANATVKCRFLD